MSPALAVKAAPLAERMGMQPAQLELIRRMCIRDDAPDDVLELYLHRCKSIGVDPFDKMIYVIPRQKNVQDGQGRWRKEIAWTFQSSIDLFRSIAEDSGDYAGQLGPLFTADGVTWVELWLAEHPPLACKVGVLRNSFKEPLWVTGTYAYYVQTDRDGKPTAFWNGEKGAHQLAKCVEELALRKAFPRKLHGIYGDDEMQQADRETPTPSPKAEVAAEAHDATFAELPPAPNQNEDERSRDGAAKQCVIYASERKIPDEHRHEIAMRFFGEPSTKALGIEDLRKLYRLLVRYSNDRAKGGESEAEGFDFEGWLDYQHARESEADRTREVTA